VKSNLALEDDRDAEVLSRVGEADVRLELDDIIETATDKVHATE
jgi:hypothetical protein